MGVAKVSQMLVSWNITENSENLINPKFNASLPVCVWIVWEVDFGSFDMCGPEMKKGPGCVSSVFETLADAQCQPD